MIDTSIAQANIDRFLGLLRTDELSSKDRQAITRLLTEEEDKLGRDAEQLEFAERRASDCRVQLARIRSIRESLVEVSDDRARADLLVGRFETTLSLAEGFCMRLRGLAQNELRRL